MGSASILRRAWRIWCGALTGIVCLTVAALASPSAEDTIRATLTRWMADFNEGRTDRICDLFTADLRYDYREFPERNYRDICAVLHRSLTDPQRRYTYAIDIKEILVTGDTAVVRLVWTLTITPSDSTASTSAQEFSMDLFRKQPDGTWKIVRFLAYEAP